MAEKRWAFRIVLLLLMVGVCRLAGANSDNGTQQVISMNLHDSGNVIVLLGGATNTEGCETPGSRNSILIPKTNPNFKAMYATVMFAMASGRPIRVWVNGCTDVWGNGGTVIATATSISVDK